MISRRRILKAGMSAPLLAASGPSVITLFNAILDGISQRAWAQELDIQPRALVRIHDYGAPSRWAFDSFLTPYGSAGYRQNPMVATQFASAGGRYERPVYVTHTVNGVSVPTMWTYPLPAPGGGSRPMAEMLNNLLSIQGIDVQNAGHAGASERLWALPGANQSVAALSADRSSAPFAALALGVGASFRFKSNASKSATFAQGTPVNLLSRFQPNSYTSPLQASKKTFEAAYNKAVPLLDTLAREGNVGAQAVIQNRAAAIDLSTISVAGLTAQWNGLLAKYEDLVSRSFYDPDHPVVGLNDLPIGSSVSRSVEQYQLAVANAAGILDLTTVPDLRVLTGPKTTILNLASRMAFTEYALVNGLTSSIGFHMGEIDNLVAPSTNALFRLGNDQHQTGVFPQTYLNPLRHRACMACIAELKSQLVAAGKFNDTVIMLSGEFNRNPRLDMSGSDHGAGGTNHTLFSGAFNGPLVIGNLSNDARLSWGLGGVIPELGRHLTLVDSMVTLAHVLRVPPPFTSAGSLVSLGPNGMVSNIGTSRYI